jgi:hypothetical protein
MDKTDLRVTFIEQFSIFDFESKDLTNGNNFHAMLVLIFIFFGTNDIILKYIFCIVLGVTSPKRK